MSDHVGDTPDLRVGGWLEVPGQRRPPEPAEADTVVFPAIRSDSAPPADSTTMPVPPFAVPEQRSAPASQPAGPAAPSALPRRVPAAPTVAAPADAAPVPPGPVAPVSPVSAPSPVSPAATPTTRPTPTAPTGYVAPATAGIGDNSPTVQFPVIRDGGRRTPAGAVTQPIAPVQPVPLGAPAAAPPSSPPPTSQAPAKTPPASGRQAPSEPPPISIRGLPMFLAALLGLGTIAIVFVTMPGSDRANSAPQPSAAPTVSVTASVSPAGKPTGTGKPSARHPGAGPSPTRTVLGSLDLQTMGRFCVSRDAGFATLRRAPQGPGAAIDNWACTGKSRTRGFTIVPTDVCQWRYGVSSVAGYLDRDDAYSWRCYR